ncbi:c-type cytochrome [Rhizobium sp. NTR19]|uniref:C-type cytochrome n=1 Tax=Neorhizobium turbinariae TaxID=2937795 RepID=A0ABT0IM17_9HYPH|nr:c-type cytochrome [Neorhizobium turbinariae]MCK8778878.1 c-type cytochrome [Neorhizobium turbinariae]
MTIRWKHLIILIIVLPLLGLAFAWSGMMGIRASTGHWGVTDWFLHWAMRNSVGTAALGVEAPPLDDPARLPPAAGHYETGCAICHGSPASPRPDSVLAMLPPPPDLKQVVPQWTDAELFEIVKHGVRYTGMPAWPSQARDDEVWGMVAFIRRLPEMDARTYIQLSGLRTSGMAGAVSPLPITCESCHAQNRLDGKSVIPNIAGQSEAYLLESLKAYAEGRRQSGVMQLAVSAMDPATFPELARHFASQASQQSADDAAASELVEKGRILAETGRPADKVPACLSCHEKADGNPVYPHLSGQPAPYLERQLHLFRGGTRGGTSYSHLMVEAAKYLKEGDMAALAAYFAGRKGSGP